jgi:hypothetical protein
MGEIRREAVTFLESQLSQNLRQLKLQGILASWLFGNHQLASSTNLAKDETLLRTMQILHSANRL